MYLNTSEPRPQLEDEMRGVLRLEQGNDPRAAGKSNLLPRKTGIAMNTRIPRLEGAIIV